MGVDSLQVLLFALEVNLPLLFLFFLETLLVPVHHGLVLVAADLHLVCELRVLIRNSYLFLKPLFLVV